MLIRVHAPTLQADPAEKDKFYTDLRNLLRTNPKDDKVFILGDSNAKWDMIQKSGKEYLGNMVLETVMTMAACYWSSVLSSNLPPQTPSTNKKTA